LDSEIVRLDIFMKEFALLMKVIDGIEHLEHDTLNAYEAFVRFRSLEVFFDTEINVFRFNNRDLLEVSLPKVLGDVFFKTNNIPYPFVEIALTIDTHSR
jgi:hypothetical protein